MPCPAIPGGAHAPPPAFDVSLQHLKSFQEQNEFTYQSALNYTQSALKHS
jgi:hypothetical protein